MGEVLAAPMQGALSHAHTSSLRRIVAVAFATRARLLSARLAALFWGLLCAALPPLRALV